MGPRVMGALLCLLALLLLGCVRALDVEELGAEVKANVSVYQDLQPGAGAVPSYMLCATLVRKEFSNEEAAESCCQREAVRMQPQAGAQVSAGPTARHQSRGCIDLVSLFAKA